MRPYRASGTIYVSRFVKVSGTNTIAQAGSGDKVCGVSQQGGMNAPIPSVTDSPVIAATSGYDCNVFGPGEECQVEIGSGGCTAGDYLKAGTNGVAVALGNSGKEFMGAQALETRNSGELCRVRVITGVSYT